VGRGRREDRVVVGLDGARGGVCWWARAHLRAWRTRVLQISCSSSTSRRGVL
jgi:hypothetical protein